MESRRRARSSAEKQSRREQILSTTEALWRSGQSIGDFAMAEVAERCGLAKGTLYLYFPTKEALFLALLERLLGAWFDDLDAALGAGGPLGPRQAAALIAATLARAPGLTRLLPLAASVLEHNIPLDAALSYKQWLLTRFTASSALLERHIPALRPGDGGWLLLQIYALVVGLAQMAEPAPVIAEALARPELAPLRVSFAPAIERAAHALIAGLAAEGAQP